MRENLRNPISIGTEELEKIIRNIIEPIKYRVGQKIYIYHKPAGLWVVKYSNTSIMELDSHLFDVYNQDPIYGVYFEQASDGWRIYHSNKQLTFFTKFRYDNNYAWNAILDCIDTIVKHPHYNGISFKVIDEVIVVTNRCNKSSSETDSSSTFLSEALDKCLDNGSGLVIKCESGRCNVYYYGFMAMDSKIPDVRDFSEISDKLIFLLEEPKYSSIGLVSVIRNNDTVQGVKLYAGFSNPQGLESFKNLIGA